MNTLRSKPLTLALIASFAVAQAAIAQAAPAEVAPRLHEDVEVMPGRTVTPADEEVISSSASRVLHHIARARDAVREKNEKQARRELDLAETLLDIIQNTVPTSMVKSRVWTADGKLKYESSEEIPAATVPIYASLDERADFDTVKLPGARPPARAETKAATKPEARPGAQSAKNAAASEETEARDASLYYEELDLPVNATRHFVAIARAELARNRLAEADQALRAALDSVDSVSVYLPDPILAARINLERAEAHYGAGKKAQAEVDVNRAIAQLAQAEKQADPESQADVKKMLGEAQSLHARMDKNEPGLGARLRGLWHRAEAHAERAMESASVGWAKLRQHDKLRGALIEAKRYVAYADIDASVAGDGKTALRDLEQARAWLDKAAAATAQAGNGQDEAVYVKDIRAVLDTLLAGQAKPGKGELANLKQQLAQAIARS